MMAQKDRDPTLANSKADGILGKGSMMNEERDAGIGFREKLSYGLGDTASNFFFQFFNLFLLYYYTDVFGLAPAAVSTMFLVTKLWDTVNDPLMGVIADRTQTKRGKYRPYLLWMAVPYGLIGYLMFANPDLGSTGKLVYAYVTYSLMMMAYTAINVPYGALMGVMSSSSDERTSLNTYRFVCAFVATLLLGMLVRPLVRGIGGDDEVFGFQVTMALFAIVSIGLFLVTYFGTKERVAPPAGQDMDVKADVSALIRNVPWLVMVVAGVFTLTNVAVRGGGTVYFFKYYVGDPGSSFFWFMDQTSFFITTGTVGFIVGAMCTKLLSPRFDKRSLMIVLTLGNAILMGSLYFVPKESFGLMVVINMLASLLSGPTPALVWSMYADVADFGEWQFKRRSTALVFSAAQFAQKLGLTLGAAVPGLVLWYVGYEAGEAQTEKSLAGIRFTFTIIPATFACLAGIAIVFYPMRDQLVRQIGSELKERRRT